MITAAVLAPLGGLVCGLISYGMALASVESIPLRVLLATPIQITPRFRPFGLLGTVIGLITVAAVVALIVWLAARAASPRRGFAAVLFGGWIAVVLGGWLAGLAGSPMMAIDLQYPSETVGQLYLQRISSGAGWGLYWGWLTGLAAAFVFMISNRAGRGAPVPLPPTP